jgi:hypothetical protein
MADKKTRQNISNRVDQDWDGRRLSCTSTLRNVECRMSCIRMCSKLFRDPLLANCATPKPLRCTDAATTLGTGKAILQLSICDTNPYHGLS